MVSWSDPAGSYTGLMQVRRSGGNLRIRYSSPDESETSFITQTISIEERPNELVVQGANPRSIGESDSAAGYEADYAHIAFVPGVDRANAQFCNSAHACNPGLVVRAR